MSTDPRILNLTASQHDLIRLKVQIDPLDFVLVGSYPFWYLLVRPNDIKVTTNLQTGKTIYLHRVIMNPPDGMVVDHINGDGLDNRRQNLRICTQRDNVKNRKQNRNKALYKGVSMRSNGLYRARITNYGVSFSLGDFDTAEKAAEAYNKAALIKFGAFALLNKVQHD